MTVTPSLANYEIYLESLLGKEENVKMENKRN